MPAAIRPLTLKLFQGGGAIHRGLLMAARRHVGAAGIEQTAALERLIAAGQEHTGLVQALRQVVLLLQKNEESEALARLLSESQQQVLILDELAGVVATALEQITATPVVQISAEVLEKIADGMHQRLYALNRLVEEIELSSSVPESATADLEAVREALETELARVRFTEHQGQLSAQVELARLAVRNIAAQDRMNPEERRAALHLVREEVSTELRTLSEGI